MAKELPDYYGVLGVKPTASAEEINKAHKALAHKHHPDKGGDVNEFLAIQEAYEHLKDPQKRAAYDELSRKKEAPQNPPPHRPSSSQQQRPNARPRPSTPPHRSAQYAADFEGNTATRPAQPVSTSYNAQEVTTAIFKYLRRHWKLALALLVLILVFMPRGHGNTADSPQPATTQQGNQLGSNSSGVDTATSTPPTPSPTPVCPTGTPEITIDSVSIKDNPDITSGPNYPSFYTITGKINNLSSGTVSIHRVGFYLGAVNLYEPPKMEYTTGDMALSSGYGTIGPKESVTYTVKRIFGRSEIENIPNHDHVTAVFSYPDNTSGKQVNHWGWDNVAYDCQPNN